MTISLSPETNLIVGPSGAGKHVFATMRLVDNLVGGRTVVAFDCGQSYVGIAQSLGGTVVTVHSAQAHTVESFGTMPLLVYELGEVANPLMMENLPHLPALDAQTFVLVDEAGTVNRHLPLLWDWLRLGEETGTKVCAVAQHMSDVPAAHLPAEAAIQVVTRRSPGSLPAGFVAGQLYQHLDGGFYRGLHTSKHTGDLTELYTYEHLWPFVGLAKWSRPAYEWAGRFTAITEAALVNAKRTDRAAAQAAILRAKAARRAA